MKGNYYNKYIYFGCQQAFSEVVGQLSCLIVEPFSSYKILGTVV